MADSTILVTGGAGYIGVQTVLSLLDSGRSVVVIDDLSTGCREAVPSTVPFIQGDAGDRALVAQTLREHGVHAVIHLAGSSVVPESLDDPVKYYRNNTCLTANLIEACHRSGVVRMVFASTAAVYGGAKGVKVDETAPTQPVSPYGASKLMAEQILADAAAAYGLRYLALRYFNVAGADPGGRAGRRSGTAVHLIEIACEAALGLRGAVEVYGKDYDTPDGTCVRDFIHVADLADLHLAALEALENEAASGVLNCGYGRGYSVAQVLSTVEEVSARNLIVKDGPPRPGDPPALVADTGKLAGFLPWQAKYGQLSRIIADQLSWIRQDKLGVSREEGLCTVK